MKKFLTFMVALLLPAMVLAQDPTPAQLQAITNDLAALTSATSTDLTQQALVVSASQTIVNDQQALATAQSGAVTTAMAVTTAEQQLETDVTALLGSGGSASASGMFDKFSDFTDTIRAYRAGTITGTQVATQLAATKLGRTPNPQRICTAIAIANLIGPIIESMMQPPGVWVVIPEPPFCTAPPPTPTPTPVPAPTADNFVGSQLSTAELNSVTTAIVNGMFPASKAVTPVKAGKRLTGAKPTPRSVLARAPRFAATTPTPPTFSVVPPQLSMWGNATYGDCVTAEEAFAKAEYSTMMLGQTGELFITEAETVSWASQHGYLNGANLNTVMDTMATTGLVGGTPATVYNDGPYTSIDWTSSASLCNAITIGPVKIGVAAGQLQSAVGSGNGWFGLNFKLDTNEDHCTSLCGYGSLAYCCQTLGVSVPAGQDPTQLCYLFYTWSTIGIVNQASLNNICGEAWLRNPTTLVGTTPPPPTPPPTPTPTRRTVKLLSDVTSIAAALQQQYEHGSPLQKANALSVLKRYEQTIGADKAALHLAP